MEKYLLVCVQDVLEKNKFIVKFECEEKRNIIASYLLYLIDKLEVCKEVYETTSDLTKIVQVGFLTLDGGPVCELYGMFEKEIHLSILYCLCFFGWI